MINLKTRKLLGGLVIAGFLGCEGGELPSSDEGRAVFVSVSRGRIATDGGATRGVGWADFDADGYRDLVTANTGRAEAVSWADHDGDGDLDLHLVARGDEPDFLFENRGSAGFAPAPEGPLVERQSHTMACWADVDADGWLDVFLVGYHSEAGNALFRNVGEGTFERVDDTPFPTASKAGRACAWGHPNDDGLPDLYVGNPREPNDLFWNRGALNFEQDRSQSHIV